MKKSYIYLVFLLPLFMIALVKLCPAPAANPAEKKMSASEERAIAAEERRAERREAREARKAERAAKAVSAQQNMPPDFGMAPFPSDPAMGFGAPPAFDPGMGFDNSMAMNPGMGFGGGFGGPGMGFGGGFGGF